jgi:hypothetical protein
MKSKQEIIQFWESALKHIDLRSELLAWGRRIFGIKTSTEIVVYEPPKNYNREDI